MNMQNTRENVSRAALRLLSVICVLLAVISAAAGADSITFYHNDALGSPVAATDQNGNVIWQETYKPFGARLRKELSDNEIWFTGKPESEDMDLVKMGARQYSPELGRFISPDPANGLEISPEHLVNRYAYANNNPYRYIDPDGRVPAPLIALGAWFVFDVVVPAFEPPPPPGSGEVRSAGFPLDVGALRAMAKSGSALGSLRATKSPVIIGENMKRVNRYADNVGGETIDGWLAGRKWTQQLNDEFVSTMKAQGRDIKDIGPDFSRRLRNRADSTQGRGPSSVYGSERRDLSTYGNYERLYERAGRYEGGVPGFD